MVIHPKKLNDDERAAMNGFVVYIGDSPVSNGSSNAICGQPWVDKCDNSQLLHQCVWKILVCGWC